MSTPPTQKKKKKLEGYVCIYRTSFYANFDGRGFSILTIANNSLIARNMNSEF